MNEAFISMMLLGAASLAAGYVLGRLYFYAVRRSVALYTSEGRLAHAAALTLARLVCAAALLLLAAKLGLASLMGAFGGFLIARALALRAQREAV